MNLPNLVPRRDDLIDAGFLATLSVIALIGFRTTYADSGYLIGGCAGLLLGLLVGHVASSLRQPLITVAVMTVGVFFLLGGAITLRNQAGAGALPTGGTLKTLADASVHGWKELLTTLPPVDSSGPLLIIPYILGLISGSGGQTLSRRFRSPVVAALVPTALLVAVILLGTTQPAARVLQGAIFGTVALIWISLRSQRLQPAVTNGAGRSTRLVTAAVLLGAAGLAAPVLAPLLPGADGNSRMVLRKYVQPPFDLRDYYSPLVGFRKYTKDAEDVYDHLLFTVSGLPAGQRVRIATLDDYDGAVWGATNGTMRTSPDEPLDSFQRVGTGIATSAEGKKATAKVTIAPDNYSRLPDLNPWLPTSGTPTSIVFKGPNATNHKDDFRYNLYTRTGVVADRLQPGDAYTFSTVLDDQTLPENATPYGTPALTSGAADFTSASATKWANKAPNVLTSVRNVAKHMADTGAYSDGGKSHPQFLPGHGEGRLLNGFLNLPQLVGDDEQYAAAFALMANSLGLPARVVFGAELPQDGSGIVKGKDIHAWVEVHISTGAWVTVPETLFRPDPSKAPNDQQQQQVQNTNAKVVPPPNPVRPPSSLEELTQAESNALRNNKPNEVIKKTAGWHIPAFVVTAAEWGGPPVLLIAALCSLILGLKALRRHRRRTRGPVTTRVMRGWYELLDHARDLGAAVPSSGTRREQAARLGGHDLTSMAHSADRSVFGPGEPDDAIAAKYWDSIGSTKREMLSGLGRWRRIRAALSLRSLMPRHRPISRRPSAANR